MKNKTIFTILLWSLDVLASTFLQIFLQDTFNTTMLYQIIHYSLYVTLLVGIFMILYILIRWKIESYLEKFKSGITERITNIENDLTIMKIRQFYEDSKTDINKRVEYTNKNGLPSYYYALDYVKYYEIPKIKSDLLSLYELTETQAEEIIYHYFSM